MQLAAERGRDRCRTPFQWSNEPNAGFCPYEVTPWLPVNPNYQDGVNVADQMRKSNSLWRYYQKLLRLRKSSGALKLGDYREIAGLPEALLGYTRTFGNDMAIILLNFSADILHFDRNRLPKGKYSVLCQGEEGQFGGQGNELQLAAFGCVILGK